MVRIPSLAGAGVAMLMMAATAGTLGAQDTPDEPAGLLSVMPDPQAEGPPHAPAEMAGVWDYNPDESVDIQTGRPEQSPRSATQRGGLGPGANTGAGATGGRGTGRGLPGVGPGIEGGGRSPRMGGATGIGPTLAMQREARDLARDLLEIPEALTIAVGEDAVTITDDLERERVYRTDGSREEHQLGASRFNARTTWIDGQLRKAIEGGFDFKMTETYFLSPDGNRLFVIIRVGEAREGRPQAGFNRVYDRVEPEP